MVILNQPTQKTCSCCGDRFTTYDRYIVWNLANSTLYLHKDCASHFVQGLRANIRKIESYERVEAIMYDNQEHPF